MKYYQGILIALFFASCAMLKLQEGKTVTPDNLITKEYQFKKSSPDVWHGKYREVYAGKTFTEGEMRKGQREGTWKFYYPGSTYHAEGNYARGLKQGDWKFYKNNQLAYTLHFRNDTAVSKKDPNTVEEVFTVVQEAPEFLAGDVMSYIRKNITYPAAARNSNITGTVYVEFIVSPLGEVTNIKIVRGVPNGKVLDEETIRMVKMMPRWKPGFQAGRPVSVRYTLPIKFVIK